MPPSPSRLNKGSVFLILALQLLIGPIAEVLHDEVVIAGNGSSAVLTTHGCGTHEKHHPVEGTHTCPICLLTAQRCTIQPPGAPGVQPLPFVIVPRTREHFLPTSRCPAFRVIRGPPVA